MSHKLAIDFGTTNSVIARWNDEHHAPEIIALPHLSAIDHDVPPTIPSLLYVHDGQSGQITAGQAVRDEGLDQQKNNRLYRNFKRGIVTAPAPDPRLIDGAWWNDRDVGRRFIHTLIDRLPYQDDIDQVVLTAPVASFRSYLDWLSEAMGDFASDRIRIVDESTAAALGYAVTEPGALVLVCDFGGGTLDLSLVQLPDSREKTGGLLSFLRRSNVMQHQARVVAKAGRVIGGSDVDQWLLGDVLKRSHLTIDQLGHDYAALLTRCEQAKIALSSVEATTMAFEATHRTYTLSITRAELEALLEANGFYAALRRVIDKVMYAARQQSIFKEDIHCVLLVGGIALMPSVQEVLKGYFAGIPLRADKPFTAVAEGALQVAAGAGLDDYVAHSYGVRYLDPDTHTHRYDEIIAMGSRYPSPQPVEVILSAAYDRQVELEFVIGEIDTEAVSMIDVKYEDGEEVFIARADDTALQIVPLNEPLVVRLDPPGITGEDCVKALFAIDDRRQLRLSVVDLRTQAELLHDEMILTLR
jgi:molecular chaperone DnaK (HSP70)